MVPDAALRPQALKPSSPQALKPSSPQALKPSSPQALKPSSPQALKPQASRQASKRPLSFPFFALWVPDWGSGRCTWYTWQSPDAVGAFSWSSDWSMYNAATGRRPNAEFSGSLSTHMCISETQIPEATPEAPQARKRQPALTPALAPAVATRSSRLGSLRWTSGGAIGTSYGLGFRV